jgi:anti-anti-sigma factor
MQVQEHLKGDILVLNIIGEININTVKDLKEVFNDIYDEGPEKVLLNFNAVEYVDSMGLATIIKFIKEMKAQNRQTAFCDIHPKISYIFRITKVDRVLTIFETEEQALKDYE